MLVEERERESEAALHALGLAFLEAAVLAHRVTATVLLAEF